MADTTVMQIGHIVKTPGVCGGAARIEGTRITVHWIVASLLHAGYSVDELVSAYAHLPLTPAQIHAAMAYYYDHREEIDALIAEEAQMAEEGMAVQREQEAQARRLRQAGYVSAEEAAWMLGLSHASRQVAKLCRQGKLDCDKFASRWVVSRRSVEAYRRSGRRPGRRARGEG